MTQARTAADDDAFEAPPPPFQGLRLAALFAALTLLILPGMWFARLAAREVSQYHASTYEIYAREALAGGRPQDALKYCAGALRASLARNDHWGTAHLLRARAYDALGDTPNTLAELNAATAFWTAKYYFAEEEDRAEIQSFATGLGDRLLAAGRAGEALAAYSAAGAGGGDIVAYLHELARRLDEGQRAALWPDGTPHLVARRFGHARIDESLAVADEQGRALRAGGLDPTLARDGQPSLLFDLSEGTRAGRSWFGTHTHIRLSELPFGVRVATRAEDPGAEFGAVLGFWFETAQRSANVAETSRELDPGTGWTRHTIARDFHREQLARADADGYLVDDGIINRVILDIPPGSAGRFWINAVEVFLPGN